MCLDGHESRRMTVASGSPTNMRSDETLQDDGRKKSKERTKLSGITLLISAECPLRPALLPSQVTTIVGTRRIASGLTKARCSQPCLTTASSR